MSEAAPVGPAVGGVADGTPAAAAVRRTCPLCATSFEVPVGSRGFGRPRVYCLRCSPSQAGYDKDLRDRKAGLVSRRPHKMTCGKCGGDFVSKNGTIRKNCYKCKPSGIRKDGFLAVAVPIMRTEMRNLPGTDEHSIATDPRKSNPDRAIDRAVGDLSHDDSLARAAPDLAASRTMTNPGGDPVVAIGRPEEGWGKCRHMDPDQKTETCIAERWSDASPFCKVHLRFWKDRRDANDARKVFSEEITKYEVLSEKSFFFKNAQDVMDFLSKIAYSVHMNWIPIGKARALSSIARVQIKALDTKIIAHRLHAIIQGLNKGDGGSSAMEMGDLSDFNEDMDLAERLGVTRQSVSLDAIVKEIRDKTGRGPNGTDGAHVALAPGGHPDVKAPDPVFPDHPEDAGKGGVPPSDP